MKIHDYQVLQQDTDHFAHVQLTSGNTAAFPVGGPYEVAGARHVLVGDLWVLAGQSNMEGVGDLVDVETQSAFVHSYQSREEWAIAEEPLHWLTESPQAVHHILMGREPVPDALGSRDPNRIKGAGLGLTFAKALHVCTGVPVGLIPCAHGGTSMEQWDPGLRDEGGRSLYGATLNRIRAVGGKVAGILWYQGESETSPEGVAPYIERMRRLVAAFRTDLALPNLPFYFVQIGRVINDETQGYDFSVDGWNGIREAQRMFVATVPRMAMVSAIDLELDDLIHVGSDGLKRLGRRLAAVASGASTLNVAEAQADEAQISVSFTGASGALRAAGRPSGFSLRDRKGVDRGLIFKVTLEGATAVLHLTGPVLPLDLDLWYGWGLDPYCNLVDGADAAVPAFGPLRIGR